MAGKRIGPGDAVIVGIQRVSVGSLRPAPWNPRKIDAARFENLKRSLVADPRLLELRPILATADGEVYAGNMRLRAALDLGWVDVPAVLEDVDDRTKRERMIRDNAQWGEWEDAELGRILAELARGGSDTTALGLEDDELTRLLDGVAGSHADADAAPSLDEAPTAVNAGDIWRLGPHRLICGDSAEPAVLARLMGDRRADLVWTDPPYGVSYVGKTTDALKIDNDDAAGLHDLLRAVFSNVSAFMRPGAGAYVCAPQSRSFHSFTEAFGAAGWLHHQTLAWVKDAFVLGHSDYHHQHEVVLYGWKNGAKRLWLGGRVRVSVHDSDPRPPEDWTRLELEEFVAEIRAGSDVVRIPRPRRSGEHPTMKPVALIAAHLRNSSRRGNAVLDPFAGSGSSLIAAQELERVAYLVEIDPRYCDVIIARWEAFTGGTAVRE